jgi:hypothetical protein
MRAAFRLFLIVYALMPLLAAFLLISTVQAFQAEVSPVYDAARQNIESAVGSFERSIDSFGRSFQPVADTINSLRAGLNTIASFINNSVNTVIGWIRDTTFGAVRIPRFEGIRIPPLVDFSFVEQAVEDVRTIGRQVDTVRLTASSAINTHLEVIVIVVVGMAVWMAIGFLLFLLATFRSLWRA